MIAAAIVCAAAVSQAAKVSWSTTANYFNGNGGSASKDTGTLLSKSATLNLYFFESESAYNTALTTIKKQDGTTAAWAKDYMATHTAVANPKTTGTTGTATLTDKVEYSAGTPLYGLIIATTEQGGQTYYYVNAAFKEAGTSEVTVQNMNVNLGGNTSTDTTVIKWNLASAAPVPEPTSGLLLLLGVAGLALRRRRA